MTDLLDLSASGLRSLYEGRDASPVDVAEAALARIAACEPVVNAFCLVDPDVTLDQARAAEQRIRSGHATGLLDGVPVAVKDVFQTRGWPTLKGSTTVDPAGPWEADAPAVAALRRHGAVLVGKTTTPEIGWKGVTDSPLHGVTRNPWAPDRTAGGSSGGSAAAAALRCVPLALGTDGGGSIRIPCGFCGLVGIKPTFGRVPLWPPSPFGSLAHAGPITRTVADTALLLTVLSEPDPRDPTALAPGGEVLSGLHDGIAGLRIAYSPDLGYVEVDPEVRTLVDAAVAQLEERGAHVEQVDPGFDDPLEMFNVLWYAGAANALRSLPDAQRSVLDPGLAEIVDEGRGIDLLEYLEAAARRSDLGVLMGHFHATHDLLVTPTLPIPAFAAGREVPAGWPHRRWQTWTPFTYPFNLTQQPAATVPCGFTPNGLPVGLQIVGPRHADALVLRAAQAYEQAHPLTHRHPPEPTSGAMR